MSVFVFWPYTNHMINDVKNRENNGETLWECDYSRLMSAILPYYFHVTHNRAWVITPEFNTAENVKPDYTVYFVMNNPFFLYPYLVAEIKSKTGDSWFKLLEQMWQQCDLVKNPSGKIWAIGQKGLEICFFRFDILAYRNQMPDCFTNFEPLNLSNLNYQQLNNMGANCVFCSDGNSQRIGLIKWRLDNNIHKPYINHMFQVITVQNP